LTAPNTAPIDRIAVTKIAKTRISAPVVSDWPSY